MTDITKTKSIFLKHIQFTKMAKVEVEQLCLNKMNMKDNNKSPRVQQTAGQQKKMKTPRASSRPGLFISSFFF